MASKNFSNADVTVNGPLNQAGGDITNNQVQAVGPFTVSLEHSWTAPTPPPRLYDDMPRPQLLEAVSNLLQEQGQRTSRGRQVAVAVWGMPGIGKTTLALQLAHEVGSKAYPDGILWQPIGPHFQSGDKQRILDAWASIASGLPGGILQQQFDPTRVRSLLNRHPKMLVVLDDVWSLEGIGELRAVLPPEAHLLVTTRFNDVASGLDGAIYQLQALTPREARELIARRLKIEPQSNQASRLMALCSKLASSLGFHLLALDIALRILWWQKHSLEACEKAIEQIVRHEHTSISIADLRTGKLQDLERVLSYSYQHMVPAAQRRFRLLGVFAPGASFGTEAVAQLWDCDVSTAQKHLDDFYSAALLDHAKDKEGRWAQNTVLNAYALHLLQQTGEDAKAAGNHARIYNRAMEAENNAERFASMRLELPQLRHAFNWAIKNYLWMSLNLTINCANLQTISGLSHESVEWCEQALAAARERNDTQGESCAQRSLGNALHRRARLQDQDQVNCMKKALDAYDMALLHDRWDQVERARILHDRASLSCDLAAYTTGEKHHKHLEDTLNGYNEALRLTEGERFPLEHALIQSSYATCLIKIAKLRWNGKAEVLKEALARYDQSLRYLTPARTPLSYARTMHNRANLLRRLARHPGEPQGERLQEAQKAFNDALSHRTQDADPISYARTQYDLAGLLSELAMLPNVNQANYLNQALSANDEALRFRAPEIYPTAYAKTQHHRALLLRDLAILDRGRRVLLLEQAFAACLEALKYRIPSEASARTQYHLAVLCHDLSKWKKDEAVKYLTQGLSAYKEALRFFTPESHPADHAQAQLGRSMILHELSELQSEDRMERLDEAFKLACSAYWFFTHLSQQEEKSAFDRMENIMKNIKDLLGENFKARSPEYSANIKASNVSAKKALDQYEKSRASKDNIQNIRYVSFEGSGTFSNYYLGGTTGSGMNEEEEDE